jgi:catechol 2,3-dioxygenase
MKVRVARLGHIGIAVRDLERSVAFYEKYLGMRLTERFDYGASPSGHGVTVQAGAFVRCATTHHELSIFKIREDLLPDRAPDTGPQYGLHHIAFEMASPDDLLKLYREMKASGVEIVNSRKGGPGNHPRFYARDPDGNLLEFYWGIDQIGWTGTARPYDPIEEIDLARFDFDAYVEQRDKDGAAVQELVNRRWKQQTEDN